MDGLLPLSAQGLLPATEPLPLLTPLLLSSLAPPPPKKAPPEVGLLLPRTGERGRGLFARGVGLFDRGVGLLARDAAAAGLLARGGGLLDLAHGAGGLPASPPRGGLRVKPTPRGAGAGPTAAAVDAAVLLGETDAALPLLSSSSFEPKNEPLKGLRRGDCREVVVLEPPPSLGLVPVRSGERSGDCRLLSVFFQGDCGGVALGVQTWLSDLTWRLQWGHLPDMKGLPPTVEYLLPRE